MVREGGQEFGQEAQEDGAAGRAGEGHHHAERQHQVHHHPQVGPSGRPGGGARGMVRVRCVGACVCGGVCVCRGSAGREGTPHKTSSGFAEIRSLGLPRGTLTSRAHSHFSPPGKGVLLGLAAPSPGSCGLKVEARFVPRRGRSPSSAAASRPRGPRSWRWRPCCSLSFLRPCPPASLLLTRNAVRTAGAAGEERGPRD